MYAPMRAWLLAVGLLAGTCYGADEPPKVSIDLDRAGAMAQLERRNPSHFAKVERILREAPRQSMFSVARWMRTNFDARDVRASSMLRTSYPAQTRISFVLDETRYSKVIYIDAPAKLQPAR